MRHYARGEALARLGNATGVRAEAIRLRSLRESVAESTLGGMFATTVRIANLVLIGRADRLAGDSHGAIRAFRTAADLQDVRFGQGGDPPRWWYPVRRSLAAALLAQGNAVAAERAASAVLSTWKLDPVTLAIRSQAEMSLHDARARLDWEAARQGWAGDQGALVPGPLS